MENSMMTRYVKIQWGGAVFSALIITCSPGKEDQNSISGDYVHPFIDEGDSLVMATDNNMAVAGAGGQTAVVTPQPPPVIRTYKNPSHVALRFKGKKNILVSLTSGEPVPFESEAFEEGDDTVLYIQPPTGGRVQMQSFEIDEEGVIKAIATFTLIVEGKQGQKEVLPSSSSNTFRIGTEMEVEVREGTTHLTGPVVPALFPEGDQLIENSVVKARFRAPQAGTYRISWEGEGVSLREFSSGPQQKREGPFEVELDEGDEIAIFPIMNEGCTVVPLTVERVSKE
jgi:hypothetical protein